MDLWEQVGTFENDHFVRQVIIQKWFDYKIYLILFH